MTMIPCSRCGHIEAGGADVAAMAGTSCPVGCGGTMRNDSRCAPWDEPDRLAYYGVDPDGYGNRERRERHEAVDVDADGDLTVSGYWR